MRKRLNVKELQISEILWNIGAEMIEARGEQRYFSMMKLFPQFKDDRYDYDKWIDEANTRYYNLMKDRSQLLDIARKYNYTE